jgi:uncharacterized protein (TIGR02145 family)
MKNIGNILICTFILTGMLLVLSPGCKKDSKPDSTGGNSTAIFNPALTYGTMIDQDGNKCKTIQIGTQVWMAENLKATKYRNGDLIGTTTPSTSSISGEINPKYQWSGMNDASKVATYGRLYTWYAVTDSRNIAPAGWHVASLAEWTALRDSLGGETLAGGKLKETGTTHWLSPNFGATNESGFTALPGGLREPSGVFYTNGQTAIWWTSTEKTASNGWYAYNDAVTSTLLLSNSNKSVGYAVRCVKD